MDNSENELLLTKIKRNKIPNWRKLTVITLSILTVLAVGGFLVAKKARAYNYYKHSPCTVPQYDSDGKLMNASVPCSLAMENVFTSHYLPDQDIYDYSSTLNGMKIFKPFKNHCFITTDLYFTDTKVTEYKSIEKVYRKISSETNVDLLSQADLQWEQR